MIITHNDTTGKKYLAGWGTESGIENWTHDETKAYQFESQEHAEEILEWLRTSNVQIE